MNSLKSILVAFATLLSIAVGNPAFGESGKSGGGGFVYVFPDGSVRLVDHYVEGLKQIEPKTLNPELLDRIGILDQALNAYGLVAPGPSVDREKSWAGYFSKYSHTHTNYVDCCAGSICLAQSNQIWETLICDWRQ